MKLNFRKTAAFLAVFSVTASTLLQYPAGTFNVDFKAAAAEETVSADELIISADEILCDADLSDNDALFAGYVEKMFYSSSGVSTFSVGNRTAGSKLTGDSKILYDAIVPFIKEIAAGERTSAVIRIGANLSGSTADVTPEDEFTGTFNDLVDSGGANALLNALLADYPYEMYWFDKTAGVSIGGSFYSTGKIAQCYIKMSVVSAYAKDYDYGVDAENYTTDASLTSATSTAVANAKKVVSDNEKLLDHLKLEAYKDAICDAVEYNHEAADDDTTLYGDPWQLIWVFDGDAETNVVCEGYSKAFQYLCDMTTFSNDISCYTVSGDTGGGHMWNIVTMEDGKNYHVDITNTDGNAIGNDGSLFLAGTSGSVAEGYTFNKGTNREITYKYDKKDSAWDDDVLTLADSNYVWNGVVHTHTKGSVPIYGKGSQDGYHTVAYVCDECPDGYIFDDGEEACSGKAADCITPAYCDSCQQYYGNPLGHDMTKTEYKEASCTESGNEEYYTCGTCLLVFSDEMGITETTAEAAIIPTVDHSYVGGTCTGCGIFEDGIGAKLAGYTLILNGNIGVNFYMELSDEVAANPEAYMQFTLPNDSVTQIPVSEAAKNTTLTQGKTYYLFACEVASDDMTGEIKAQIIIDDETKGTEYTYKVQDYAEYIINNPDIYTEGDVKFAKALLNYGANSQLLFNTDTENLANSGLDESDKDVSGVTADSLANYKVTSVGNDVLGKFVGSNLVLESETTLKVYFKPVEGIDIQSLTFTIDGQEAAATEAGAYYALSIEDIKAYDLDKSYELKVTDNNGNELIFSTNAMAYCYNVLKSDDYSQELKNLVAALRIYNEASEIYAAS